MEKRVLICGGCSYTGGGGFNVPFIFKKEFNTSLLDSFKMGKLDWSNPKFTKFIEKHLWPEKLKELTGHDSVYNCAIGARGPVPTLNFLIDTILKVKEKNPKCKIDVIYQIPESAREDIWFEPYERPVCLLTNFDDIDEYKKYFYTNFFDDDYSFLNQIENLYRFKKFISFLNINLYLFSWDEKFIENSDFQERLNKRIKSNKKTQLFWKNHVGNVLTDEKVPLSEKLKYIDVINFDGMGLQNYAIKKYDNFTFEQKYKKHGVTDTHATKEGMELISKELYERIYMQKKSSLKKVFDKIFG